jgi:predicted dehydrogenase
MEAMWSRFLPATRHVRELLAAGRIGAPRFLTADFSYSAEPATSKRNFQSELAGGGLLDVGIYAMALASLVFGPLPDATSSFAHIGETGVDEHAALLLRYPGGGIASLTCGVRALGSGEARLVGTEGRIELKPFWRAESVKLITRDGEETTEFPFEGNGFEYEIREVMDCVRQGRIESPQYPLDESIAIMETMDGFRREWGLVFPME